MTLNNQTGKKTIREKSFVKRTNTDPMVDLRLVLGFHRRGAHRRQTTQVLVSLRQTEERQTTRDHGCKKSKEEGKESKVLHG